MYIGTVKKIWRYPVKSMGGEMLQGCHVTSLGIAGDRGWAVRDEGDVEIKSGRNIPVLLQCTSRYLEEPSGSRLTQVEIMLPDGRVTTSESLDVAMLLSHWAGRRVTLWPIQPTSDLEHYRRKQPLGTGMSLREVFALEPEEPLPDLTSIPNVLGKPPGFVTPPGSYFDTAPLHILTTASLQALNSGQSEGAFDDRRFRPNILIETEDGLAGFVEQGWSGRCLRFGEAEITIEGPTVRCAITTYAQRCLAKEPSVMRALVKVNGQHLGAYASVLTRGEVLVGDHVQLI